MQIWNKVLYLGINSECEIILGLRWDNLDGNLNSAFSSSIAALAGGELPSVAFLMRGRFLSSIAALAGVGWEAPFGRMFNEREISVQHCCARWGYFDWIACEQRCACSQASF